MAGYEMELIGDEERREHVVVASLNAIDVLHTWHDLTSRRIDPDQLGRIPLQRDGNVTK